MIDVEALLTMAEQGYVRRQWHPELPYAIYNYTEKATYEGVWNDITRACRGLILDDEYRVIARPFRKFFNYGDHHAPELDLDARVFTFDKLDGSLGILYPHPQGGFNVATRGSFTSDQAIHATQVWCDRYQGQWAPPKGTTALFEIIYPANRIVVDYDGLDDLVWLDTLDNATGQPVAHSPGFPGPRVDMHTYATLRDALGAPPRPGKEGFVIWFPEIDERIKLKQADYVEIHRLVFGLTKRKIWERVGVDRLTRELPDWPVKKVALTMFMDPVDVEAITPTIGTWLIDLCQVVPEEFATWATEQVIEMDSAIEFWMDAVHDTLDMIHRSLGPTASRAELAAAFQEIPDFTHALFAALDKKPVLPFALRAIQPEHETFQAKEVDDD